MQRVTLLFSMCAALLAQAPDFDFYSRGPHDPKIPRPETVVRHAIGERHSYHHQMEAYIQALASASLRVKVVQYGESYEGRKTYLVIISSEENMARLEEIRAAVARLTDPRKIGGEAELKQILSSTPAVVWLNYANDGNESAAFEAGLQTACQLAAGEDAETRLDRQRDHARVPPGRGPEEAPRGRGHL